MRDSRKLAKVLTEVNANQVTVTMASILLAWRGLEVALQFIADTKKPGRLEGTLKAKSQS